MFCDIGQHFDLGDLTDLSHSYYVLLEMLTTVAKLRQNGVEDRQFTILVEVLKHV